MNQLHEKLLQNKRNFDEKQRQEAVEKLTFNFFTKELAKSITQYREPKINLTHLGVSIYVPNHIGIESKIFSYSDECSCSICSEVRQKVEIANSNIILALNMKMLDVSKQGGESINIPLVNTDFQKAFFPPSGTILARNIIMQEFSGDNYFIEERHEYFGESPIVPNFPSSVVIHWGNSALLKKELNFLNAIKEERKKDIVDSSSGNKILEKIKKIFLHI